MRRVLLLGVAFAIVSSVVEPAAAAPRRPGAGEPLAAGEGVPIVNGGAVVTGGPMSVPGVAMLPLGGGGGGGVG